MQKEDRVEVRPIEEVVEETTKCSKEINLAQRNQRRKEETQTPLYKGKEKKTEERETNKFLTIWDLQLT